MSNKYVVLLFLGYLFGACNNSSKSDSESEGLFSKNRIQSMENADDLVWADSVFIYNQNNKSDLDYSSKLEQLNQVFTIYALYGDTCKMAHVQSHLCNVYNNLGQSDKAIQAAQSALSLFQPYCDSTIYMSINSHYAGAHINIMDNEKALEICDKALSLWNPAWTLHQSKNRLLNDRAISLVYLGRYEESIASFKASIQCAIELDDDALIEGGYMNLGGLYGFMGTEINRSYLDSAEAYFFKALELTRRNGGSRELMMFHYGNIGALKKDREQYRESLEFIDSSYVIAEQLGNLAQLSDLSYNRSNNLLLIGDCNDAYAELLQHIVLRDSLLNVEKIKVTKEMQEKYESEKKERQIKELEVVNLNAALREEQLTKTRNVYLFSGLGIFLIATGLYRRLRFMQRAKIAIQKEKDISEGLLLNILPQEVAEELKVKGYAEAQLIEEVSVLFTDFKGFTALSESVTPKQLVHDLHACFSAFDGICGKYGIEKIKTIGDAYMAAGGLPTPNNTHAEDVVRAALEMSAFVEQGKQMKIERGEPFFEIRVGVHTGPVVAGIVGIKKFQYDIWGDTVNTASRMESSGAVGKVNISQSTYEIVKDKFDCEFRGQVEAKGKGKLNMYFVGESRIEVIS